jgi:hypothetical protein
LDNRIENLRDCSHGENQRNAKPRGGASKFKGVYKAKCGKKWGARIKHDGATMHLGTFSEEENAARAYDAAAKKYHGEFCSTNERFGLYK